MDNSNNNQSNLNNNLNSTNQVPVESLNVEAGVNPTQQQPNKTIEPQQSNMDMAATPLSSMNLNNQTQPLNNNGMQTPNQQTNLNNPNPVENNNVPPVTPVGPTNNLDNFNAVPTPPVIENPTSTKKKGNKNVTIILLILMVFAIGFGLYYFLVLSKNNTISTPIVSITPKEVHIELKEDIPADINEYATISGIENSICTLDTTKINSQIVSRYNFTITCNNITEEGIAIVEDTTNPGVILNDLEILIGFEPEAEDFIDYCIDATNCSYEILSDLSTMINTPGEHEVNINISDAYNNETNATAKLVVGTNVSSYITCTAPKEDLDNIYATQVDTYKIGLGIDNKFYNATKTTTFVFEENNDYVTQANNYNTSTGINNVTGKTYFDKTNNTIIIKNSKTFDELNTETKAGFSSNDAFVIRAFLTMQGYICE